MSHALLIQHRTRPGKRDAVERIWRQHMQPAVARNEGHLAYAYCFGADETSICAFQHYRSKEAAAAFLKEPAYAAYLAEVGPLLAGEPIVTVLEVRWSKAAAA